MNSTECWAAWQARFDLTVQQLNPSMSGMTTTRLSLSILEQIRQGIADDLKAVDQLISTELSSQVPLIQTITQHIVSSGGKRLRPLVVLLTAKALNYHRDTEHHELAAVIEFIHTATLLHDDVVDDSALRRGQPTANAQWGNPASVLVGDFLYSRAFQILARRSNIPVMKVLANTTNHIAEGEVLQLIHRNDATITEAQYQEVIRRKTAQLFSAAAEIGALIGSHDHNVHERMAHFGLHLGIAYQMIDDVLDYTASPEEMGKNIGDDLAEGKATLPLIYALHHATPDQAHLIHHVIQQGGLTHLQEILQAIEETNARQYTLQCAKHHAELAQSFLTSLPDSRYRQALYDLTIFIVDRNF